MGKKSFKAVTFHDLDAYDDSPSGHGDWKPHPDFPRGTYGASDNQIVHAAHTGEIQRGEPPVGKWLGRSIQAGLATGKEDRLVTTFGHKGMGASSDDRSHKMTEVKKDNAWGWTRGDHLNPGQFSYSGRPTDAMYDYNKGRRVVPNARDSFPRFANGGPDVPNGWNPI